MQDALAVVAPSEAYCPTAHAAGEHNEAPGVEENVPLPHGVQTVAPTDDMKDPAGQGVQTVAPVAAKNLPAGQLEQ